MRIEPHALRRELRTVASADDFMAGATFALSLISRSPDERDRDRSLLFDLMVEVHRALGEAHV